MPSAFFRFGANAEHETKVECGYFGSEKYFVDGKLIHTHWSLRPNGIRNFTSHGHKVQVRMTVNRTGARAEAWVDDQLVAENIFAEFNARVAQRNADTPWLLKVVIWLVIALACFLVLGKA